MNGLKSVLVGVDFTVGCGSALQEALRIARWNQARVEAVHIIDTIVAAELEQALSGFQKEVRAGLEADARRAWQTFAKGIGGAADVAFSVRIDNRVRGVLAAAAASSADLLVLGALGTGTPDVGLGTIATGCVRQAPCDVLLVRDTQPGPFQCVVACVDFSPTSLAALDQAARIAAQDSAALHIVHVFTPPWRELHYRSHTPEADPHFRHQYRHGLERRLSAFAGELGREIDYLKPTFSLFDYEGHRSGIVEYADRAGADLVVLGTRGRTNLRDVLLGSTAEKALRESRCSVLAVRAR